MKKALVVSVFLLTLILSACGQSNPQQGNNTGKGITIYEDPSLSATPEGGVYPQGIIPVQGAMYGSCYGGNKVWMAEGQINCTFPLRFQDAYQGNYQLVVYGPGFNAQQVVFRKVGNWWEILTNFANTFSAVVYTNGCREGFSNCRHYWGNDYTKVDIRAPDGKRVLFYLTPTN